MTEEATEIPRCCSISIQSEAAWRWALRDLTLPAIWMAPAKYSRLSGWVVVPASGCEIIAKVRRRATSEVMVLGMLIVKKRNSCVAKQVQYAKTVYFSVLPVLFGVFFYFVAHSSSS